MRDALIEAMRHAISFTPMWDGDTIGDNLTRDEIVTAATRALDTAISLLESPSEDMKSAVRRAAWFSGSGQSPENVITAMLNTLKAPA